MSGGELHAFVVENTRAGQRLDRLLADSLPGLSRSRIQTLIEQECCRLNGVLATRASLKLRTGDRVELVVPVEPTIEFNREDLPLSVVHQGERYLVVVKPPGLLTHPGPADSRPSVAGIISRRFEVADPAMMAHWRPGIVHRLDRDTSGLLIVALDARQRELFSAAFKSGQVRKTYRAIVRGVIVEAEGEIDAPIGRCRGEERRRFQVVADGRPSLSRFRVVARGKRFTEVLVFPKTGRTHQIRVHFQFIGHALVNDPLYGKKRFPLEIPGQLLCAEGIAFICPETGREVNLACEPDARFAEFRNRFWE